MSKRAALLDTQEAKVAAAAAAAGAANAEKSTTKGVKPSSIDAAVVAEVENLQAHSLAVSKTESPNKGRNFCSNEAN